MKIRIGVWMAAITGSAVILIGAEKLNAAGSGTPIAPIAGYAQGGGWDVPPPELDEVSRRGFHDGVEGARKDYGNKRRPDVNNRDEYRHPHVPDRDKEVYRRGFERGYQVGVDHLYNGRL